MSKLFAVLLAGISLAGLGSHAATITVNVDKPGVKVSPMLYGLFFEEINRAGDGGLYAEMIVNRNFEDNAETATGWTESKDGGGSATLHKDKPLSEKNRTYLRLDAKNGRVSISNEGFTGMERADRNTFKSMVVQKGEAYRLSLYARTSGDNPVLTVSIDGKEGKNLATHKIPGIGREWKKFEAELTPSATEDAAKLVVTANGASPVDVDMVSLIPKKTYKDHGLRIDLMEKLAALKPAFVRFPGGCWVEGNRMADAYRWKQTIGELGDRRNQYNIWRYHSTHGLGYHEYLQMCEDLNAEPLFVINCGMSHRETVPMDKMDEYVQDALDAIEYANGPADSKWGALRAKAGHPKPFNLKFLEIGNENGGPAYDERYAKFYDAIKTKYPAMKIIANVWGGTPRSRPLEIIDEHEYNTPQFFMNAATRYDKYDRNGPQIYMGEYAVTRGSGQGNLIGAIGEAAFMTGMERNSDIVVMSSYAPLFAHVGYKAWNPNAIYFDAAKSYGTPSYWVQQMFANNRPEKTFPVDVQADAMAVEHNGAIGLGTWHTQAEFKDIKVTSDGKELPLPEAAKGMEGWKSIEGDWAAENGVYAQRGDRAGCFITAGDPAWKDYTLSLKARKTGGAEGFLIRFHSQDDQNYAMWNIGGYGNSRHQFTVSNQGGSEPVGRGVRGRIETNRWYDIRVEVKGDEMSFYLDDKLIEKTNYPATKPLFATAGKSGNELILKVVNGSDKPQETTVSISGISGIQSQLKQIQVSGNPNDENSLAEPEKIVPKTTGFTANGPTWHRTFPPYSVTIIRATLGE